MKIKNVSNSMVIIQDLPGQQGGSGLQISPNQEIIIYDEDAEKSRQLLLLIESAVISKTGTEEPLEDTEVGEVSAGDIRDWGISHDSLVHFVKEDGTLPSAYPHTYISGTHAVAKSITLCVTDLNGVKSLFNSASTITIGATGGTVNGLASATVTVTKGLVTVSVVRATAGNVDLAISAVTHPLSAAIPPTVVAAAGAAVVPFA